MLFLFFLVPIYHQLTYNFGRYSSSANSKNVVQLKLSTMIFLLPNQHQLTTWADTVAQLILRNEEVIGSPLTGVLRDPELNDIVLLPELHEPDGTESGND